MHNRSLKEFGFDGTEHTPRIYRKVGRVLFPSRFLPVSSRELSELGGASFLFHASFVSPGGDGLDYVSEWSLSNNNKTVSRVQGSRHHHGGFFLRTDCGTYS
jgi:hypothetical protein